MSDSDLTRLSLSIRRHQVAGLLVCIALVAGVGGWAAATSLTGAVVAGGTFVVGSHVKKVQHPTGGVVGELLVREGQRVAAGDPLIRLDATQTLARLAIVLKRLDELRARKARLEAERDGLARVVFPQALVRRAGTEDELAATLSSEARLFAFRRQSREGRKSQLRERISQFKKEIEGLKAQETAFARGLSVLEDELAGLRELRKRGLVTIQRMNALDREAATLGGERGEAIAGQAQAGARISEARLQILQVESDLKTEVGSELREIDAQIGEFVERHVAARDELRRVEMTAPQGGVVHQLAVHAAGAVVSPADTTMLIVPDRDTLAVEARIAPQDIDQIHIGQHAVLRLSAFNQRTTPELAGKVTRIAADLTHEERTGLSYYLVRISVAPAEIARLGVLELVPGMPAEAFISTGERTALSYLLKPLSDQIARTFREE
ncbi:HlyD family type I secretion periplasmic adaptor subunit [Stappia sp.]|uniref:HlyD family type I secretion periplasmic adaptor subunit n=1 Tax=Stappia sp. TaxID=1870903 RepID=UPI003D11FBAC